MACLATLAELAAMLVVGAVAGNAGRPRARLPVGLFGVASTAHKTRMCTREAERRLGVMVELPETPAIRIMTIAARGPKCLLVPVIFHMAGHAFPRCIAIRCCQVTPLAGNGRMQPDERKPRQSVIKLHLGIPRLFIVAAGTVFALLPFVHVILRMAGHTVHCRFLHRHARFVTCRTLQSPVRSLEGKPGLRIMVKGRLLPAAGGMATLARRAVRPLVLVIRTVAGDTRHLQALGPPFPLVAGSAFEADMPARKRKACLSVMVKADGFPRRSHVTARTELPVRTLVSVVNLVT